MFSGKTNFMAEQKNLGETTSGLPANIAAAIACVFPLLGGIAMLLLEKTNRFVRFYALQSIYFGLAWFILNVGIAILHGILHLFPLIGSLLGLLLTLASGVVQLGLLAIWAYNIYQAVLGTEWEIPYIGPYVRRQMGQSLAEPPFPPTDSGENKL